jgi:hypothetical protein
LYTGANSANAQSKLSFGLNVGAGIPMASYAKHDSTQLPLSNNTTRYNGAHPTGYNANDTTKLNGFAKTGFHFNVYGQYMIAGPIGVKLMIGGTMNSYDIATFNSSYAQIWYQNNPSTPSPTWTSSKNYFIGQYMVGPCLKLPAGDKLRIEGQILVGLVTGSYPSLTGTLTEGANSFTETYAPTSSVSAFGYNINAGVEYMVTDMIGLHLNVGYTGSSFSYASYSTSASETVGGTTTILQPPTTYNLAKTMSVGIMAITIGGSIDL